MAHRATRLVVPDSTVPGTRAWAETVAANARQYAGFTEKDVRPLVERYRQLIKHEAWELWYSGQLGARDRFFRDVLGYETEFLETMSRGVEILDGRGHEGPIPSAVAERAAALDGKTVHKARGRTPKNDANSIINLGTGSTSANYLTRRIARDFPDILARMKTGEFSSVRAAALEAGIIRHSGTVRYDDPESAARTLRKHMPATARRALARLLLDEQDQP